MELKLAFPLDFPSTDRSFNRTEMELKLAKKYGGGGHKKAFNRTEMELKQLDNMAANTVKALLIVPKWN